MGLIVKKHKSHILLYIVTISVVSFSAIGIFHFRTPSQVEIYENAISNIVEVKSETNTGMEAYGTGIIINADGTIVSNSHLVTYKQGGAYYEFDKFSIRFANDKEYRDVELVKYDLKDDISVLKLKNTYGLNLKKIRTRDSDSVKHGETVYAIGNGLNHGVGISQGIISLPKVTIIYDDYSRTVIQSDITINEGNSGGALLDKNGNLIGMITFRLRDTMGNIIYGIAYSLPSNLIIEYLK